MKLKPLLITCALSLGFITSTFGSNTVMTNSDTVKKATYIQLTNKPDSKKSLREFLIKGADLVRKTEPNTALWFAFEGQNHFAIFDVFYNEEGRAQHFAGQVANALKENSEQLINGGWEQGVLKNIHNYDLIAANHFDKKTVLSSKEASYIVFKAKNGKSQEVEQFLKTAASLIDTTEPNTYFWVALKTDKDTFAILDTFPNQEGQNAHFSGEVASKLKQNAEELIEEGWEKGILAHVENFKIIASS